MCTLLIDNYDSYTYNLFQLLGELSGKEPIVVKNDEASWSEVATRQFDSIVISPGPGTPERAGDFGISRAALEYGEVPVLGVCLGHQGLGHLYGAQVVQAPEAMHGRVSAVYHGGDGLFSGLPQGFRAVRYHSLVVASPVPSELEVIAWAADGVVMGLRHRRRPLWGVQFHPESICTQFGRELLSNFQEFTHGHTASSAARPRPRRRRAEAAPDDLGINVHALRLSAEYDPESVFVHLLGDEEYAFWLDSSMVTPDSSRFTFMGAGADVVSYDVSTTALTCTSIGSGETATSRESVFAYLSRELGRLRCAGPELPFDFNCGFVGYFGYELKAECGGDLAHQASTPDASFLFADRILAFDHELGDTWLVHVAREGCEEAGQTWLRETRRRLDQLPPVDPPRPAAKRSAVPFSLCRSREQYLRDIAETKRHLLAGESYEVCLTNTLRAEVTADPLSLYRVLRRVNPAPYAAYLRLGDLAVLSSSPERFLRVDSDGGVEAKPIKGTAPRSGDETADEALLRSLEDSEKTRAENLMIVDLLRNDLGRVCEVGSVRVPKLMHVESYKTVHQLVSTIRGRLRPEVDAVECVQQCFPGGSMTGAPKRRTMEIIDRLEKEARGVYSGALGFLSLNGAADLSIVIRTMVLERERLSIGVGGAIVMQSDDEAEFEEILLKGRALQHAAAIAEAQAAERCPTMRGAA